MDTDTGIGIGIGIDTHIGTRILRQLTSGLVGNWCQAKLNELKLQLQLQLQYRCMMLVDVTRLRH